MDLPESLKAALGTAGGGVDAATSAVDAAVSSAVASASKLTAVAGTVNVSLWARALPAAA